MNKGFDREAFKCSVVNNVKNMFQRITDEVTPQQIFQAVAYAMKDVTIDGWIVTHREYEKKDVKTVYYLSMEFLMGYALGNDIINTCVRDEVKEALDEMDSDLNVIRDQKLDVALGDGGLGRLAACSPDSLTTLDYPAYGYNICYRYDMFKQKAENGHQVEVLGNRLKDGDPFEIRRPKYVAEAKFGGYVRIKNQGGANHFVQDGYRSIHTVPYGLPVIGYSNNVVNILHIWDAEPTNTFNLDSSDRGDYQKAVEQKNLAKTIVGIFYPNDNHYAGKELRLKQQYFSISASVQRAVRKYKEKHDGIRKFYEKVVFQLNSTHPTVAILGLTRVPLDEEGFVQDEVWEVTIRICAYTNHTIVSETLEEWPIELFSRPLSRIYQIVEEINRRFQNQIQTMYPGNQEKLHRVPIIYNGQMKMAYMATVVSFSVDDVVRLHTETLKHQGLKDSCGITPEKLSNKIDEIVRRRFLLHGNPLLADWVTSKIGDEWITDFPHIKKLELFAEDEKCQFEFINIKYQNKLRLAGYIKENNGINADPRSVFSMQVRRLHEYKHRLMNILRMMYLYNQLRDSPNMDIIPRTFISGTEAVAGYKRAKLIIKLINSVADIINNDKSINGKIKVVFTEDYRVSNAELIFATVDVSEQIPTTSEEVSGISNIKFVFNRTLTLGTMNGVNVEIVEEVDVDNALTFDVSSDEVTNYENNGGYYPMDIFNSDQEIRHVFVQLISGYHAPGSPELFGDIYNSLLNTKSSDRADAHFIFKDFRSCAEVHQRVDKAYRDQTWWAKAVILNMVDYGKLTSDCTIEEYMKDIWHLKKVTVGM